jgi:4-diphosphocytidyl-2-C-methyl-D-erythritol kinase
MIVFPNCKINLGLQVLEKRTDGYHNIETVFYPIFVTDVLEIISKENSRQTEKQIEFSISGIPVQGNQDDNLCIKAYSLLKKDFPQLPPLLMHLHKAIPIGAGLGGGSSDAAFTLQLLNQKYNLDISPEQLKNYSLQLGSDCPFFIINQTCVASGRGELLEKINLDLTEYKILLVAPGIHINTSWAFSQISLHNKKRNAGKIKGIIHQPIETWKTELKNDFEEIIFPHHPEINSIKEKLYEAGAVYASMSGSGSAVYGIFKKEKEIRVSFPSTYFLKESIGQR